MNIRLRMLLILFVFLFGSCISAAGRVLAGDIVAFGRYEQDNDLSDGAEPIEWEVLPAENGEMLLISRYGLDALPYHAEFAEITWADCTLREWLNGTFFEEAFSDEEKAKIVEVLNENPDNPEIGTDGGADTADRVFLLSIDEVLRFFPDKSSRICEATGFAKQRGALIDPVNDQKSYWWLRSPGYSPCSASIVYSNGLLYMYGSNAANASRMVRPVIRVRMTE